MTNSKTEFSEEKKLCNMFISDVYLLKFFVEKEKREVNNFGFLVAGYFDIEKNFRDLLRTLRLTQKWGGVKREEYQKVKTHLSRFWEMCFKVKVTKKEVKLMKTFLEGWIQFNKVKDFISYIDHYIEIKKQESIFTKLKRGIDKKLFKREIYILDYLEQKQLEKIKALLEKYNTL